MNNIVDFSGGRVYINNQVKQCIYAITKKGDMTPNILISYEDFKKVFEIAKGIKILRHEEL